MSHALITPMLLMMLLIFVVWSYMFYLRIGFILGEKVDVQKAPTRQSASGFFPDEICGPADNFQNMFEMPVVFFAITLLLLVADLNMSISVSGLQVFCAYGFVLFRAIHSYIHCFYNNVNHRFSAYLISSIFLWIIVIDSLLIFVV